MEQNSQKSGVANLILLLAAGVAAFAVSRNSGALAGQVATVFLALGALVAAVSWFQTRMEERERLEKLEFDELTKTGTSATLFNTREAEVFPARRAREQFEKFFVPGFTILLLALEAAACWWCWRWLDRQPSIAPIQKPLMAMAILGLVAFVCFLIGRYSTGLARLGNLRLLVPGASFLLFGAYLLALAAAAIAGVEAGFPAIDSNVARALCALLALLAAENLITLLLEIYRPRVRGKVARLLYDSRLVGLISHPEGIFTTAAHALDYQFGFKVSETWFYQFLQRSLAWLVLAQIAILLLSTCFIFVETGQQALLERFGRPVAGRAVLAPGFHFKLPWPIDQAYRYPAEQIQTFNVGFEDTDHDQSEGERATLWTVSHYKEEFNLLVASRESQEAGATNNAAAKKAPPVNLLSVGIPVQYQVTNLPAWAYNNVDSARLLKDIATAETIRHLVGVDINEVMSSARFATGEELRRRIQARADERNLGAQILFVGLADVHPPVAVGAAYEKVVGAKQKLEAEILKARAYALRTNALATAAAYQMRQRAEAQSTARVLAAVANESLFTNQMAAYASSPSVYAQRAYLQTLARHGGGARKYILTATNREEVLQLNLEEKISDALLKAPLPAPK